MPPLPSSDSLRTDSYWLLVLLWLGGVASRVAILAVPPVIPLIHQDLHLSETQVGLLIGLPLGLFAAAAVPGSLLVARIGERRTMLIGLLLTALASASPIQTSRVVSRSCRASSSAGASHSIRRPG